MTRISKAARALLVGSALGATLLTSSLGVANVPNWASYRFNLSVLTARELPPLDAPRFVAWTTGEPTREANLKLPLLVLEPARDEQLAALLSTRPQLAYTPPDSALTLSVVPGSPCTGACFKLAGSF